MTRYSVERTGYIIKEDTDRIPSNCHQLIFTNVGDTPAHIQIDETELSYKIEPEEYVEFGLLDPRLTESNLYKVTFDTLVTEQKVSIMRVYAHESQK